MILPSPADQDQRLSGRAEPAQRRAIRAAFNRGCGLSPIALLLNRSNLTSRMSFVVRDGILLGAFTLTSSCRGPPSAKRAPSPPCESETCGFTAALQRPG